MSSNLLSGYAGAAVNQQQLLAAGMIVFRPWTNCPWIVRSGDNLSVETTMETTLNDDNQTLLRVYNQSKSLLILFEWNSMCHTSVCDTLKN